MNEKRKQASIRPIRKRGMAIVLFGLCLIALILVSDFALRAGRAEGMKRFERRVMLQNLHSQMVARFRREGRYLV